MRVAKLGKKKRKKDEGMKEDRDLILSSSEDTS
jgi:hypothetical protein